MKSWILASFATAFLFGSYNIFAKLAAGKLTDSMAAFVLELSAAMIVLIYILFGGTLKTDFTTATSRGVFYAILGGLFIGSGSIFYLFAFRQHAPLAIAGPIIFAGATLIMVLAGLIFFREKLNLTTLAGLVLTLGGIVLLSISANRG
jgi:uncharacterized membrane protein